MKRYPKPDNICMAFSKIGETSKEDLVSLIYLAKSTCQTSIFLAAEGLC
jgi:hypothetical protein